MQVASMVGTLFDAYGEELVQVFLRFAQQEGTQAVADEALWQELVQAAQAGDSKRTKNAFKALLRAKQGVGSRFQARPV
jgi:hypothetical protein